MKLLLAYEAQNSGRLRISINQLGIFRLAEMATLRRFRYSPPSEKRPPRLGSKLRPWAQQRNALVT